MQDVDEQQHDKLDESYGFATDDDLGTEFFIEVFDSFA